jgi:hypothetical protein
MNMIPFTSQMQFFAGRLHTQNRQNQSLSSEVHGFLTKLKNAHDDFYSLITLDPPNSPIAHSQFKAAIKTALEAYTFFDPAKHGRLLGFETKNYTLIKLTGLDCSYLTEKTRSSPRVSSPYSITPQTFNMSIAGAKALCSIIRETPEIDSLIIAASCDEDSFGDEIAEILANELPSQRFKLLKITGGYGTNGMSALQEQLPHLVLEENDPLDIELKGLN